MLEGIIEKRIEKCSEVIKKEYPQFLDKGEVYETILSDPFRNPPLIGKEFIFWSELKDEFYWRAIPKIKTLMENNKDCFSKEELETITRISIKQMFKGAKLGGEVPRYSDLWEVIEASPLKDFIKEEDKKETFNIGFWNCLNNTTNIDKRNYASQWFTNILGHKDFFKYIDFEKGVEEAKKVSEELDFYKVEYQDVYLRWYLVQETALRDNLKEEDAEEICGKLIAPYIHTLLTYDHFTLDEENKMYGLMNYVLTNGIIKSKEIQRVLGSLFERHLTRGLDNWDGEFFDHNLMKRCEGALVDKEKHITKVWEEVKDNVNVEHLRGDMDDYVPKEFYEAHIKQIKQELKEMKRVKVDLVRQWMDRKIKKYISPSTHTRVRNQIWKLYSSQKQRPKLSDINYMHHNLFASENLEGFILADYLKKEEWEGANEIILYYQEKDWPKQSKCHEGFEEYVKIHGKIKLNKNGLEIDTCYPKYNAIIDFKERNKKLFI